VKPSGDVDVDEDTEMIDTSSTKKSTGNVWDQPSASQILSDQGKQKQP
jgi:hypothetical protein